MERLILVRHAHAASNADERVNALPPGLGLSARGREQARALHDALEREEIELGIATELARTGETLAYALAGRDVPTLVDAAFNEIGFGSFEGGTLADYRAWAWAHGPDAPCPGGGESRAEAAARLAGALAALLAYRERTILLVGHALPLRYLLDAADGRAPAARIEPVAHAEPWLLPREAVAAAAAALRAWSLAPHFSDTPFCG